MLLLKQKSGILPMCATMLDVDVSVVRYLKLVGKFRKCWHAGSEEGDSRKSQKPFLLITLRWRLPRTLNLQCRSREGSR